MEVKTKLETDLEYRLNDIKDNLKRKIISGIGLFFFKTSPAS